MLTDEFENAQHQIITYTIFPIIESFQPNPNGQVGPRIAETINPSLRSLFSRKVATAKYLRTVLYDHFFEDADQCHSHGC